MWMKDTDSLYTLALSLFINDLMQWTYLHIVTFEKNLRSFQESIDKLFL